MTVNRVKRNGSYAPLSAHYYKDDAVDEAGEAAELLYVRGLAFCAEVLSDGFISDRQLVRFVGVGMFDAPDRAAALVSAGLWMRVDGGYQVRSWLDWNRSRVEISDQKAKDAQRKRGGPDSDGSDEPPPPGAKSTSERNPNGIQSEVGAESDRKSPGGTAESQRPSSAGAHARNTDQPQPHDTTRQSGSTAPRKRGTRLPDDWVVSAELRTWFQQKCPDVDGRLETERFKNHFLAAPGQKGVKLDWDKTWQNWMLTEQKHAEQRRGSRLQVIRGRQQQSILSSDPETALTELRARAAGDAPTAVGREVARLLSHAAYVPAGRSPGSDLSELEWNRRKVREYIDANEADLRNALACRDAV